MMKNLLKTDAFALAALMSLSLASCGKDEPGGGNNNDNPGSGNTDNPAEYDAKIVGTWDGYAENEKLGDCYLSLEVTADHKGKMVWRDLHNLSVLKTERFKWSVKGKDLTVIFLEDNGEPSDDTDVFSISRLNDEVLMVVFDDADLMAFIRSEAQVSFKRDMLIGTWLYDYQWSESRQMWRYDEVTFKADGKGHYIENAYRLSMGGSVDEFDFTWSVTGPNTVEMKYQGEEGMETMTQKIGKCCSQLIWCIEDDEPVLMLRK